MGMFLQLITAIGALVPSITEAKKVLTDADARKENASAKSTTLAKLGVGAAGVIYIDPDLPPDAALLLVIASAALYLYRRKLAG